MLTRSTRTTLAALALLMIVAGSATAEDLSDRQMVGGRVGGWFNTGDDGPVVTRTDPGETVEQDINSGGLYAELVYSRGFSKFLRFEFNAGLTSRTDLVSQAQYIYGPINLYPIQFALRLYPFGSLSLGRLHPYGLGGFALTIASQARQGVSQYYASSRTKASVDLLIGAGIDIPVASQIALNVSGKYHHVDFGEGSFDNVRDFSGFTAGLGVVFMKR